MGEPGIGAGATGWLRSCWVTRVPSVQTVLLKMREKLRRKLFKTCGIAHLDFLLFDVKTDDEYKECRTFIIYCATFVPENKCFATQTSCKLIVSIPEPPNTVR